ncbi:contractile injection system protein, VgrG/Pvc8 family [Bradyrhizobium sp. S3.2.12]|uniref:phage late control D family protein n=1 Tax=Bradyrhizobium sp. S3.2.12 TaxID=3156387 RepID=UPI003393E35F
MELVDLSRGYGDFYAPAFTVRLAGADIARDLSVAVSEVEVDMVLGAASRFSFTLSDCYSHKLHAFNTGSGADLLELLTFGTAVEICIGYGDAMSTPTAIIGMVTELSTNFPETGSPDLIVSGYDHAFPLTLGKNSDSWQGRTDSDVVQQIASFHNLTAAVEPTTEKHPQIEQNQESDWDFLKKLAERNSDADHSNHFEVYIDPGGAVKRPTLHFGVPRVRDAPTVRLVWGEGLLSFKPEANLAGQVSKVEVYGWDVARKQAIVGHASADDGSGPQGKSVSQYLNSLVRAPGKEPTLRLRQPVFTQAEADKRAKAALGEKTKKFLTGDAEAVGLPELRPDRTVQMDNLGEAFSKAYYIEQATHRVDSGGYRTRFKVRETKL